MVAHLSKWPAWSPSRLHPWQQPQNVFLSVNSAVFRVLAAVFSALFLTCSRIAAAGHTPAASPVLPLQSRSKETQHGGLKSPPKPYQSVKPKRGRLCKRKAKYKCSILQIPLPSWVSLEDTLNAKLSEPSELMLRQTREGMSLSGRYKVMRLLMPTLPRGTSLIGMSAEWLTGSPANSQTREGGGFAWLSQEHRIWDKILTQREEGRISGATETENVIGYLYKIDQTSWGKIKAYNW